MSKFTKGPWRATDDMGHPVVVPLDEPLDTVCTFSDSSFVTATDEANARLIAAAPEMYDLLEQLAMTPPDETEEIDGIRKQALALLARIDGE